MAQSDVTLVQQRYDRVAASYDDFFSRHVAVPQRRLTEAMGLQCGDHVIDLACGTGLDAVEMLERTAPGGSVTAVDCSEKMLNLAQRCARERQLELVLRHQTAEQAIASARDESWDAISVRFALAYLDWKAFFAELPRTLRPEGRVAVLTSLGSSLPQARSVVASLARDFGVPEVQIQPNVPADLDELLLALEQAHLRVGQSFVHRFQLWFPSGLEAVNWLIDSGYATHPFLERMNPQTRSFVAEVVASRLDGFREEAGVPLQFELAGVIALHPDSVRAEAPCGHTAGLGLASGATSRVALT